MVWVLLLALEVAVIQVHLCLSQTLLLTAILGLQLIDIHLLTELLLPQHAQLTRTLQCCLKTLHA